MNEKLAFIGQFQRQGAIDSHHRAKPPLQLGLLKNLGGGSNRVTPEEKFTLGAISGPDVEVICGANLPLLVKLVKMRDKPLDQAVQAALEAGHKYIDSAASILDPARKR